MIFLFDIDEHVLGADELQILTNLALLIVGLFMFGLQRVFYGPLRPIEREQLYEKAWFAVTETCLAMAIFRGTIGPWFGVMFVSLLTGKVWGWIGEGRVEILEQQPPANPRLFHTRLAGSLALSVLFDTYMLEYSVKTVLRQARPDMMVMFGFEFAILSIIAISTAVRYFISLTEIYMLQQQKKQKLAERRREIEEANAELLRVHAASGSTDPPPALADTNEIDEYDLDLSEWEDKGRYIFYLDLASDFMKLVVYLSFFTILLIFYGLPIHIMRDVFLTCRSFYKRITDYLRYRNATKDMNDRYPDATAEEIAGNDVCIICREEMQAYDPNARTSASAERNRPKRLPCGHTLHFSCLRKWLERQQICPTCRHSVLGPSRHRRVLQLNGGAHGPDGQGDVGDRANPGAALDNAGHRQDRAGAEDAPDRPNRARIITLGPIRIGFGTEGDLTRRLATQGNGRRERRNRNVNGSVRELGPEDQIPTRGASSEIQTQLLALERRIADELMSLRASSTQLQSLRHLHAEMTNIRTNPNHVVGHPTTFSALPHHQSSFQPMRSTQLQHYQTAPRPQLMTSDSPDLPEGLSLPNGWTMLPLQRMDRPPSANVPTNVMAPAEAALTAATVGQQQPQSDAATVASLLNSVPPTGATAEVPAPVQGEASAVPGTNPTTVAVDATTSVASSPQMSLADRLATSVPPDVPAAAQAPPPAVEATAAIAQPEGPVEARPYVSLADRLARTFPHEQPPAPGTAAPVTAPPPAAAAAAAASATNPLLPDAWATQASARTPGADQSFPASMNPPPAPASTVPNWMTDSTVVNRDPSSVRHGFGFQIPRAAPGAIPGMPVGPSAWNSSVWNPPATTSPAPSATATEESVLERAPTPLVSTSTSTSTATQESATEEENQDQQESSSSSHVDKGKARAPTVEDDPEESGKSAN